MDRNTNPLAGKTVPFFSPICVFSCFSCSALNASLQGCTYSSFLHQPLFSRQEKKKIPTFFRMEEQCVSSTPTFLSGDGGEWPSAVIWGSRDGPWTCVFSDWHTSDTGINFLIPCGQKIECEVAEGRWQRMALKWICCSFDKVQVHGIISEEQAEQWQCFALSTQQH